MLQDCGPLQCDGQEQQRRHSLSAASSTLPRADRAVSAAAPRGFSTALWAWSTPDLRLSAVLSMFCSVEAETSRVALLGLLMASCPRLTPGLKAVRGAVCVSLGRG